MATGKSLDDSSARGPFVILVVRVPVPLPYRPGKLGPPEAVPLRSRCPFALPCLLNLQLVLQNEDQWAE